jgi:multiple sugar transport system ATP-binding protein
MVYVTHDQVEALTLGDRVAVMRTGVLQQVASPKELYERPVNLFVAGFIGSPAMNFMSGTLEDGKLRTGLGDFTLTDRLRREVESSGSGREVIVGLRPENFEDPAMVSAADRPNGATFRADIDVLESMGSDVFVYFTRELDEGVNAAELEELAKDSGRADTGASGETVVARLDAATRIREGHDAELWVDTRKMQVFDPTSGRNLSLGDAGAPADSAGPAGADTPGQASTTAQAASEADTAGTADTVGQADTASETDTR